MSRRTVNFYVREHRNRTRKLPPEAAYLETLGCYLLPVTITLSEDEFAFISRLASRAISAPLGSQERREGLNEVITLVEVRHEFPEAEFEFEPDANYRPSQESLFQIPDKAKAELDSRPQQPLPMDAAHAARDEAIRRVDMHAEPEWKDKAMEAIRRVALRQETLISDDVWVYLGEMPREPRAIGPLMLAGAAKGYIVKTDQMREAHRVVNHARPQAVWRSLVYQP